MLESLGKTKILGLLFGFVNDRIPVPTSVWWSVPLTVSSVRQPPHPPIAWSVDKWTGRRDRHFQGWSGSRLRGAGGEGLTHPPLLPRDPRLPVLPTACLIPLLSKSLWLKNPILLCRTKYNQIDFFEKHQFRCVPIIINRGVNQA